MLTLRHATMARAALCSAASLAVSALLGSSALAQSSFSYGGGTYSQNFNTLPSSGTFSLVGDGPFDLSGDPIFAGGMNGWSFAKYAGSGANASFLVSPGTSTSGAAYSYGAVSDSDRALGLLASGTNISRFGATFINNSSITFNQFSLSYIGEQWRRGSGAANTLTFEYALGGGDINTGAFVGATALNFTSPITTGAAGALNGNDAANRAAVSGSVSGFSWAPGQTLVLRWTDIDDSGSDDGLAIDDLSFIASTVRSLVWNPAGAGGNTWSHNPANTNWLDGGSPASFMSGDLANFTDAGVGMVVVDDVTPGATNVSNSSGTYGFVGGAIGGSGALTKTGGGALLLDNVNTYTGGTVVNGGLLLLKFDANLGAAGTGITMGGGTIRTLSAIVSTRALTLTEATTSTMDILGPNHATFGGVSGGGSLIKQGGGSLTFTGAYNMTGTTSVLDGALVLAQPSGAVTLTAGSMGNDFAGDLVLANGIRLNFNTGNYSGGGTIRVNATGTTLGTTGSGQLPVIGNHIVLNNVNQAPPFVTFINSVFGNTLAIDGVISGNADVNFALGPTGGGGGVVLLNNTNTWTGATHINNTAGGVVRLGTGNALPQATALVFGSGSLNVGALDLAGFSQTVASLASDTTGTINGIANTGGSTSVLTVAGSATTTYAGSIGIPANVAQLPGANAGIALVLAPTHTGQLTLAGANNYVGGTTVHAGTLVAAHPSALGSATLTIAGGLARLAPGLGAPVTLGGFVDNGGRFDLTDNPVVIDYDGPSPLPGIVASIASAYAGGAWNGSGITSSAANAGQFAVGYAEANALPQVPEIFGPVDDSAVLLRLTRYGDANLDGTVNLQDFNRLAANFGAAGGARWWQGDFNYDGMVNLADFNRLAANFGLTAGPDGPTPQDWADLAAAVPEPGTVALLPLLSLVSRRHRRHHRST